MDTASLKLVVFGLAVALVSNISRSRIWRSIVLMVASIMFLGLLARNPIVFLPLVGFLLLGFGALCLLERGCSRCLIWSILALILAYMWLKRYTLLPEGILIDYPYFTIGLSYIFFRIVHLLIDAGEGCQKRHIGLGSYLLYTLNFTTLVSGPIQHYDDFARDQFASEPISLGFRVLGLQLERLVLGFFKVNVLSMLLHTVQEDALAQMQQQFPLSLRLVAAFRLSIAFPLFLYCNFSGYIDIVIALARLIRLRLPENFERPFSASSFLDFWSRWHITLSTWFKTYVYNPLLIALMRRVPSLTVQPVLGVVCFFVTFFLVGIWHGRTSEFVVYGMLQGGGISINKLWQLGMERFLSRKGYRALAKDPVYVAFGRGLTFSWTTFTLYWLWADWKQISQIFAALGIIEWLGVWMAIWLCATAVLALWESLRAALLAIRNSEGPVLTSRYARTVYATAMAWAAFVMTVLLNQPYPTIVYKAF